MTREQKEYKNFLERAQKIPAVTTVKQAYKRLQSETNEPLFHDMTSTLLIMKEKPTKLSLLSAARKSRWQMNLMNFFVNSAEKTDSLKIR